MFTAGRQVVGSTQFYGFGEEEVAFVVVEWGTEQEQRITEGVLPPRLYTAEASVTFDYNLCAQSFRNRLLSSRSRNGHRRKLA